jgi:hypothetical protein
MQNQIYKKSASSRKTEPGKESRKLSNAVMAEL